jgi:hypothetical protein
MCSPGLEQVSITPGKSTARRPGSKPPVTTVRKQLGHRNIQSTLLYAEVDQATIKQDLQHYQRRKGRQR